MCNNTPTTNGVSDVYFLKDRRYTSDGLQRSYRVKKLGNYCWMTQNLALTTSMELSHTYSNVENGKTYTTPSTSTPLLGQGYWNAASSSTGTMSNGTHQDNLVDNTSDNTGAKYSLFVATANSGVDIAERLYNTTYDICPDGWHLPSWNNRIDGEENQSGELAELAGWAGNNWNSWWFKWDQIETSGYFKYFENGWTGSTYSCSSARCTYPFGSGSHWWSSTFGGSSYAYNLLTKSGSEYGIIANDAYENSGLSVRCVAK